ncbi:MAG: hypothetical protein RIR70_2149 [Pseudomonadota bacterium]|jgi:2-polyprenyl-3-methyl-5-hydroxy-6-metoxy-1,4-benzoquinol methylase
MSSKTCTLCGSPRADHFTKTDAKDTRKTLSLMTCLDCSLVQQADIPAPEVLRAYYSHHYRTDYKSTYTPKARHVYRAGRAALDRLAFLRPMLGQRVAPECIDIGAGGGEFVYLANRMNIRARGIEPNIGYSAFARDAYDVTIDTADIDALQKDSADIVTMFHVLEHLPDPEAALRRIHAALRPGGLLLIEVPNILQKDASPHNIYFGAHLFYFSLETLRALASPWFELVKADSKGNVFALFRRRDTQAPRALPSALDTQLALARLKKKGWVEYLTEGGAPMRLGRRIAQRFTEMRFRHQAPRQILDQLFDTLPPLARPQATPRKWLPWAAAAVMIALTLEALC